MRVLQERRDHRVVLGRRDEERRRAPDQRDQLRGVLRHPSASSRSPVVEGQAELFRSIRVHLAAGLPRRLRPRQRGISGSATRAGRCPKRRGSVGGRAIGPPSLSRATRAGARARPASPAARPAASARPRGRRAAPCSTKAWFARRASVAAMCLLEGLELLRQALPSRRRVSTALGEVEAERAERRHGGGHALDVARRRMISAAPAMRRSFGDVRLRSSPRPRRPP